MKNFKQLINIFYQIDDKIKQKLLFIVVLMIIIAVLELFGIALLIPIVKLSLSNDYVNNEYIQLLINTFHLSTPKIAVVIISSTIVLFFIIKALFIVNANKYIIKFTNNLNASLSSKIFLNFLKKSYNFYLDKNTNILLKNILTDANQTTNQVFLGYITVFSEMMIISFLYLFMLYNSFLLTMSATIFIVIFAGIFKKWSSSQLLQLSKQRDESWNGVYKNAMDGLNGIKEVKTYYLYDIFLLRFKNHFEQYAIADSKFAILNILPRYVFEVIFMSLIIISIMILTIQEINMIDILPILTAFIFAIIKLIPSLTKIISLTNNIKYYSNSIEHIKDTFNDFENIDENNEKKEVIFNKNITINNGTFEYNKDSQIFQNLNINISKNETVAFVGRSGSGKSTFIDLLMGFLTFKSNSLYIDEKLCYKNEIRQIAGYIPQNNFIFDESLKFNICFGDDNDAKLQQIIKLASLEDVVAQLPNGVDEKIGQNGIMLSGGQRQRIGIARALYKDAQILIFDEATSALDNHTEQEITKAIENLQGKYTIILIAHRLSTVRNANLIYVMENGNIKCSGSYDSLQLECNEFKKLLGEN